ncbi:MAG TPA: NAD(P)-dependent oxidoreductase [Gemmatimonadaceae bacterium]
MKVFVAGATGVVGRRLIPLLVDAGADVTAVARTDSKASQLKKQGARPMRVDLFDPARVEEAVAGHDAVINVATKIPSGARVLMPGAFKENIRIRTEASQNIASAAISARARVFIQESFAPVYPDRGSEWIDETVPIQPASYVRSVMDAESAADEFTKSGGRGVVLRFSMFYGPDSSLTLDMVNAVKRGFAPALGGGDAYMSSLWTDDAASAVFAALSVPAGAYNVSDDEPMPRRDVFTLLAQELGVKPPRILPRWASMMMGSVADTVGRSHRISNAKFRQAANWIPKIPSVREGWRLLVEEMGGT